MVKVVVNLGKDNESKGMNPSSVVWMVIAEMEEHN